MALRTVSRGEGVEAMLMVVAEDAIADGSRVFRAATLPSKFHVSGTSAIITAFLAQEPDGVPREVSLPTTRLACSGVCTGSRPMAISSTPVFWKSTNQPSEADFR